jgi:predicted nucleotidyltransferase component of viral defense system
VNAVRAALEVFHLLFLQQLGTRVAKDLCVLKGGCNLRFFLRSLRYSEDMDFDVQTISRETLKKNVETIIESPAFARILQVHSIAIRDWSAPKQTNTVQRWKLRLEVAGAGETPTKIEFSRRGIDEGVIFEPVDGQLLQHYRLAPILASHYRNDVALAQKVGALALRTETQARDVFDLKLLIDAGAALPGNNKAQETLALAADRAMSIGFDEFQAQVVAFLPPDWQEYYGTRDAWNRLQEQVVDVLTWR